MKERPSWTEYIQPAIMGTASMMSVVGSLVAISVGADRTPEGKINPFFYIAGTNSFMYTCANIYRCTQIYKERNETFVQAEERRAQEAQLKEVVIE